MHSLHYGSYVSVVMCNNVLLSAITITTYTRLHLDDNAYFSNLSSLHRFTVYILFRSVVICERVNSKRTAK